MACQVKVDQGWLQGKECVTYYGTKYYSFEGVPYAKPPIGELRFRDPQPPESWEGIKDATKPGNKCAQADPGNLTQMIGSEDCLYLNIYTPSLPAEKIQKLPVLFYLHGGRLLFGYGDYYKPDHFLKHDVILVTLNVRLNVLGFLCLHTKEVPGNAGIKDAIMALKWVKKNICQFNGDAGNVTVFGESSGSATVSSFLFCPLTYGCFNKMILESGNSTCDLFMDDVNPLEKAKYLCSLLDNENETDVLKFLQSLPIEHLIQAFSIAEFTKEELNPFFCPVVEKKFDGVEPLFTEHPSVSLTAKRFLKVPVLSGMNSHEGGLFLTKDENGIIYKDIKNYIPKVYRLMKSEKELNILSNKMRSFYFKDRPINETTKKEFVDLVSDAYFAHEVYYFNDCISKENDLYYYLFSYNGNLNTRVMKSIGLSGATHSDILAYQFYRKSKIDKCNDNDWKVVNFLTEAWCNFAKNGKPTSKSVNIEWPKYNVNERLILNIGDNFEVLKYPLRERMEFWRTLRHERAKL